jgi:hypothetical protein
MSIMSTPYIEATTMLQTCTYVLRIDAGTEDGENPDETRSLLQSYLGSEHEVISLNRMRFNDTIYSDDSEIHHVLSIKTRSPTEVATKLMGDRWVRKDHILFTARPNT